MTDTSKKLMGNQALASALSKSLNAGSTKLVGCDMRGREGLTYDAQAFQDENEEYRDNRLDCEQQKVHGKVLS